MYGTDAWPTTPKIVRLKLRLTNDQCSCKARYRVQSALVAILQISSDNLERLRSFRAKNLKP